MSRQEYLPSNDLLTSYVILFPMLGTKLGVIHLKIKENICNNDLFVVVMGREGTL